MGDPVIEELLQRYVLVPEREGRIPQSPFGFNWVGEDRAVIHANEEIDLEGIVAEVRERLDDEERPAANDR